MRTPASSVLVAAIVLLTALPAWSRCGDDPNDADAVAAAIDDVTAHCRCCSRSDMHAFGRCARAIVRDRVAAGALRRACAGRVRSTTRHQCREGDLPCATPVPTATPVVGGCTTDADCDDANGCSADHCSNGTCMHECLCDGPAAGGACCAGPTAGGTYFFTCGDPVCHGHTRTDLPACAPEQRPGSPCCPGQSCDPGDDCNRALTCADSDPTNGGMCPISRREFKHDVRYLEPRDQAAMRDQLLGMKLATYAYTGAPASDGTHLGFIIDDVARPSPSVAADGTHVDLYGYTSMAVAAIQTQARQIAELERQVTELRVQLATARRDTAHRNHEPHVRR